MLEAVRSPIVYFFTMIVVFSVASLPPSPPTLMAAKANAPWLLATLAAVAAGLAAVFDHYIVRRVFRVRALERVRRHRFFERAERWAKVAPFFTVFLFAAVPPLPFNVPRVLVPLSGYPWWRYAAATAIGRFPRVFVLATFGQFFDVPAWALEVFFAVGLALTVLGALVRWRRERAEPAASPVGEPPEPPGGWGREPPSGPPAA